MDKYSFVCPPGRCQTPVYAVCVCVWGVVDVPGAVGVPRCMCTVSDVTLCRFER